MQFVIINKKVTPVLSITMVGEVTTAKAVISVSTRTATANKSPGPGWYPVVGQPRRWSKVIEETGVITITGMRVYDFEDWPIGAQELDFDPSDYEQIITEVVNTAVSIGGSIAKRVCPQISVGAIFCQVREARIPLLNEEELETAVMSVWERDHKKKSSRKRKPEELVALADQYDAEQPKPE